MEMDLFPRLFGIPNKGNTCYINAVLQVIMASPRLSAALSRSNHKYDPTGIAHAMRHLIRYRSPDEIVQALQQHIKDIHRPNDSHEVMCHVLDAFSKEPDLAPLFEWRIQQTVVCEVCGDRSDMLHMHTHLMMPPMHQKRLFTPDAIASFCTPDTIPGWKCKCSPRHVTAIKQSNIVSDAPLLFVSFDVWGGGELVTPSTHLIVNNGQPMRYELVGLVCYHSYHYTAIVMREGRWFFMDDDNVHEFDPTSGNLSLYPYICLYEKL